MSLSDNKKENTIRIRFDDAYKYRINAFMFDSMNRNMEYEYSYGDETSFELDKGLYTLRLELNGEIKDEVILVNNSKEYLVSDDKKSDFVISPPKQYSSALLGKTYASSYEYYTYPAIKYSEIDTYKVSCMDTTKCNSSLFIYLRFPSKKKYEELKSNYFGTFYSRFVIVDANGNLINSFEDGEGVRYDEDYGWVAFNCKLTEGVYFLLYHDTESRQIPIYVFNNWHTQFFMTLGSQPLFGTIRIFISASRKFSPDDETYRYIDILLDKLQNRDYTLNSELIEMAAYGKYRSPMLGLLCSYIYLKSKDKTRDDLFTRIVKNLQSEILEGNDASPDLKALNLLAADHLLDCDTNTGRIYGTPMLRIGFEAILEGSVKDRNLIPARSVNDFISENLYSDSPFTTFKPLVLIGLLNNSLTGKSESEGVIGRNMTTISKNIEKNNLLEESSIENTNVNEELNINDPVVRMYSFLAEDDSKCTKDRFEVKIEELYDEGFLSYIKSEKQDDNRSWIENSISELLQDNQYLSINDISADLNVSGNTVNRVFENWIDKDKGKKF